MVQELLPYISLALQWARAQSKFSELLFIAIVAVASFGFYALANPENFLSVPWNIIANGWWAQAKVILASVQLASSGANILVAFKAGSKDNPLIPVTNSKP